MSPRTRSRRPARLCAVIWVVVFCIYGTPTLARAASIDPLPLYGPKWCLSFASVIGCGRARGFTNPSGAGAMSADGRSIYLPGGNSPMLAVLRRNPDTGTLLQPAGGAGCFASRSARKERDYRARSCAPARGLAGEVHSVVVSPDGRHLYAATATSVAVFARAADGRLAQPPGAAGCVAGKPSGGCSVQPRLTTNEHLDRAGRRERLHRRADPFGVHA